MSSDIMQVIRDCLPYALATLFFTLAVLQHRQNIGFVKLFQLHWEYMRSLSESMETLAVAISNMPEAAKVSTDDYWVPVPITEADWIDKMDQWHADTDDTRGVVEYLGITEAEYKAIAEGRATFIKGKSNEHH